ncbi:MAG: Rrf2 family transcriptional regulator [Candidatus Omnitrophota bacterium]
MVKLITKNTDYAIRALVALGQVGDDYISARDLSLKQSIPYEYLRKILQVLIGDDLVESKEGGSGGFKLNPKALKIKVTDVMRIFQGDIQLSACMFRKKLCPHRDQCALRDNIQQIERSVIRQFGNLTVEILIQQTKRKGYEKKSDQNRRRKM